MIEIESGLQKFLLNNLPASGSDALVFPDCFDNYRTNPSLIPAVLSFGDPKLHPWAFYGFGVELTSKLDPTNTSTYASPPSGALDFESRYAYPMLILQQIIQQVGMDWHSQIGGFYLGSCPNTTSTTSTGKTAAKCSRYGTHFNSKSSPLYLSLEDLRRDPLAVIVPRIRGFKKELTTHGGIYCKWCSTCANFLKTRSEEIIDDLYDRLVACVGQLNAPRGSPASS